MKLEIKFNVKKVIFFLIVLLIILLVNKAINHYFLAYEFSDKYEKSEWFYKIQRHNGLTIIEISGNSDKIKSELYLDFQPLTPLGIVVLDDKFRIIKKLPIAEDFDMADIDKDISYSNFSDKTTFLQHIKILNILKDKKSKAIKFYYD